MVDVAKLTADLQAQGVEFVFGYYVDIHGVPKSKCVPIASLPSMAKGSELYTVGALEGMGDLGPHEDECAGIPDLDKLVVLPWDPRFAVVPSQLQLNGVPYGQDSRNMLQRQVDRATALGFTVNVGIEPEFYVVRETATGWEPFVASDALNSPTRGYDLEATILSEPFVGPMARYMNDLNWGLYSFDHEGGDGQYEFNFDYTDAMSMADRMTLFRLMAKHVARQVGCIATFMAKPFQDDFGSAAHINISIASAKTGENLFAHADGTPAYSDLAGHFTAGVLQHANAISAVVSPTVNSYKRFTSKGFMDEISWAPVFQAWGNNNRTLMCRMPVNRHCLEVRTADASVNYYLGMAVVIAAGLDGIEQKLDAGAPVNVDTYLLDEDERKASGLVSLPTTLDAALDAFEIDDLAKRAFTPDFHATYLAHKRAESHEFRSVVTEWESATYMQRI